VSIDLVTSARIGPADRNNPWAELQNALLHNPNNFLKLGIIPASTTCFENTARLIEFKEAEAKQTADPESRALEKRFGK